MGRGVIVEHLSNLSCQTCHVLVVLDNWNPLSMLVGCDALEALQHFVPFDGEALPRGMPIREKRAPHRVGVEHCPGAASTDDFHVEPGFR